MYSKIFNTKNIQPANLKKCIILRMSRQKGTYVNKSKTWCYNRQLVIKFCKRRVTL